METRTRERSEIKIENVSMTYPGEGNECVKALDDVSLDIRKGEFISLLGPSGCGKTTLLRIIADLLAPTAGSVTVAGESPTAARMSRKYGIVFQSPVLYDWRTVRRNVRLPLEVMKIGKSEWDERVDSMLELVGLSDFGGHAIRLPDRRGPRRGTRGLSRRTRPRFRAGARGTRLAETDGGRGPRPGHRRVSPVRQGPPPFTRWDTRSRTFTASTTGARTAF